MALSEEVKEYWAYKELRKNGYSCNAKEVSSDDRENESYELSVKGNGYDVTFEIVYDADLEMFYVYYDGENITAEFDFAESLEECEKGCIYYFYTRF